MFLDTVCEDSNEMAEPKMWKTKMSFWSYYRLLHPFATVHFIWTAGNSVSQKKGHEVELIGNRHMGEYLMETKKEMK